MADDYSADSNTTGVVQVGGSASGELEWDGGDRDWFRVTLAANTNYLFALSDGLNSRMQFGVNLSLHDATGVPLGAPAHDANNAPIMSFTCLAAGDYFVSVNSILAYGRYSLSAAIQPPDDLPRDSTTTALLTVGTPFPAAFEMAGDQDWFKIYLEAGKFYAFTVPKGSTDAVFPTALDMFDASGNAVTGNIGEPTVSGMYYIALQGNRTGPYTMLPKYRTDDYSSNTATTGVLTQGVPATGEINYRYDSD